MKKTFNCKGWNIFFHPVFEQQYTELENQVRKLKQTLEPEDYITHNTVKLFAQVTRGFRETIPQNPFADYLILTKSLQKYGRLKKKGLNHRYRLFFRAFKKEQIIVILWLGYPRKEGDKKDCYEVFQKEVNKGKFPASLESLLALTQREDDLQ